MLFGSFLPEFQMNILRYITAIMLAAALGACGGGPNDPGVGGVTRGEADALNDAAAMLDDQSITPSLTNDTTEVPEPPQPE